MQYLAMIYGRPRAGGRGAPPTTSASADLRPLPAFADDAREAGVLVDGAELAADDDATTVRVRDGETLVTDGPFAESKEALGGYFLLECGSFDEALDWAARIPGAEHGAVEVRPVLRRRAEEAAA